MNQEFIDSFEKLKKYCEAEGFKGWDPYDGLNSEVFKALQLDKVQFFRLAWIQIFKRSPINFRKLALVEKGYNPKGLGLFLTAYCNLYKVEPKEEYLSIIHFLANKIIETKTTGYSGSCWGYNFDWQSRLEFMPDKTPTVVATSFVSYALMDAYDITKEKKYLNEAISSCEFVINDLNRTENEHGFIFSYSPLDRMQVYNASLLGSRLLSRVYSYTGDKKLIDLAKQSVNACCAVQREDGAWRFGADKIQTWVDSFHTGYKLESISEYQKYSGDKSYNSNIECGLKYYVSNFFLEDGTPKYYDKKVNPIDIHCPSEFVAAIFRLNAFDENRTLIEKTLRWTIENMQDPKEGYFYYQINSGVPSKIPYMRWGQAWMLYGFSFYFLGLKENEK
ncbi:MAG: delta-aminolevulinic acid dehydratase [Campylobacterales bacterium]|nr:delta-aminolevulinic acid dehydratase [Campylobacterales bacterium]